jgi:predicted nuclease of predicted toxin-antitoxin system
MKFLVDESLSPQIAAYLKELGYEAESVRDIGLKGAADNKIIEWAQKNKNPIITGDLDFGELWYWHYKGTIGIVVLRVKSYKVEAQKRTIDFLHQNSMLAEEKIRGALLISTERKYRLRTTKN